MTEQKDLKSIMEKCQKQLQLPQFKRWKDYLHARLITDDLIDYYQIGLGQFFGKLFIVLPVLDIEGVPLFFKLRKDPIDVSDSPKFVNWPGGNQATIYPWAVLKDGGEKLAVVEGEMDCILMNARGIPAITSTAGAGTFKDSWLDVLEEQKEIYCLFDRDEAGFNGSKKLCQKILKRWPAKKVNQIILPNMGEGKKDITDYFLFTDGNIDKLFSAECCHRIEPVFELEKENFKRQKTFDGGLDITQTDIDAARNVDCSQFVKIENKASGGINFARCPLKEEKTASFACYPEGRGYYCFSCGSGGDAIDLVQKLYKLSFPEAVKYILENKK